MLEFATLQGAKAYGLDYKVGSLTPGKEADIVLINTNAMNVIPLNNPVGAVVEFSNVGNVDTIFVGGKIKKKDGKLIGIDFPAFRKRVCHRRPLNLIAPSLYLFSCTQKIMAEQEKNVHKKPRGRPAGRLYGETIPVRLTREMIAAIDKWIGRKDVSRSEAIRALIERGLSK